MRSYLSSDQDRIQTKAIKFIFPFIVPSFTRLANFSFENGVFPIALNPTLVIILFTGGSWNDPANYLPISVLSVFRKIFERLLSRLLDYLNSKHFFHDFQFRFRAKYSTEHAHATFLNYLHSGLESCLVPGAFFLMFEKHMSY